MALRLNQIFVNLPVRDLEQTKAFFSEIGFEFNEQFTDENAACMVVNDQIYVMLLVESLFKNFTQKEIADTTRTSEVIIALSAESREQVDEVVNRALAAGGKRSNDPVDHGMMYYASFQDINGHIWELTYMDPAIVQGQH